MKPTNLDSTAFGGFPSILIWDLAISELSLTAYVDMPPDTVQPGSHINLGLDPVNWVDRFLTK